MNYASMNWSTKKVEGYLSGRLRHGPVLHWMAATSPSKRTPPTTGSHRGRRSRERIYGIVARIMALERATTGEAITGTFLHLGPAGWSYAVMATLGPKANDGSTLVKASW